MVKDLKTSGLRYDESFRRTARDLTINGPPTLFGDNDSHHSLQVSAEVPASIRIQDIYGSSEIVKGRADWVFGYGTDESDTGSIILVVETKPYESAPVGMPQLVVCMAAAHEARQDRVNSSVFRMVSDSKEFRFCFLNGQK